MDAVQYVVEVVGHAARKRSDAFEFLRLEDLRLDLPAVRNVHAEDLQPHDAAGFHGGKNVAAAHN